MVLENNAAPVWEHKYSNLSVRGGRELLLPDIGILKYLFKIDTVKGILVWKAGSNKVNGKTAKYIHENKHKVSITDSNKKKTAYSVDKIIYYAATGHRPDGGRITHIDGNGFNDKASNLKFVAFESTKHKYIRNTISGRFHVCVHTTMDTERYKSTVGTFDTIDEAEIARNDFLRQENLFHLVEDEYPHLVDSETYSGEDVPAPIDTSKFEIPPECISKTDFSGYHVAETESGFQLYYKDIPIDSVKNNPKECITLTGI